MKIIPFGTNGFFPSFNRQTACYVISYGKILIILDAGSGLFRFSEPTGLKLLNTASEIHLFLSHYHLDHTFGFYAAFELFKNKKVYVYAMRGPQIFSEMITVNDFSKKFIKKYPNFNWKTVKAGDINLDGYNVRIREQNHRNEKSLAYRMEFPDGKSVAYVTDGEAIRASVNFVLGVKLLLHEYIPSRNKISAELKLEDSFEGGHVTTAGAALIAKEAKVGRLFLIHSHAFYAKNKLIQQLKFARKIFKESYLAM